MNNKSLIGALVIIIIGLLAWYFLGSARVVSAPTVSQNATTTSDNMGTYSYECDEHVAFTMTPSSDMGSIKIAPVGASSYPPATTLYKEPAPTGVRYVGSGILFNARGETVTLGQGSSMITCTPTPSQTEAPFNFGD